MPIYDINPLPEDLERALGRQTTNARAVASFYAPEAQRTLTELLYFACVFSVQDRCSYALKLLESYAHRQISKTSQYARIPSTDVGFLKECITRGWPNY